MLICLAAKFYSNLNVFEQHREFGTVWCKQHCFNVVMHILFGDMNIDENVPFGLNKALSVALSSVIVLRQDFLRSVCLFSSSYFCALRSKDGIAGSSS